MTKRNKYVNKLIKTSEGLKNQADKMNTETEKYKEATIANSASLGLKEKLED